jgi:lysophospholipase L1-like esterase
VTLRLYEHGLCLGDSLTTGARTRYGLAEELADQLNRLTNKRWLFRCEAANGDTVLQLLRRMDQKPWMWQDATFVTLMIGTNDSKASVDTPPEIFRMLFGQILDRLIVAKLTVFPALIPDLQVDASLASPYDSGCRERIRRLNDQIRAECSDRALAAALVDPTGLPAGAYVDGVHLSAEGLTAVARRFAEKIVTR